MTKYVLTSSTSIQCPHGGKVTVTPSATRATISGEPPLRVGDGAAITGCPFTIGNTPSPCVRVEWLFPAGRVTVEGSEVLTHTTVGLCTSGTNLVQGTAVITGFQTRVTAQ